MVSIEVLAAVFAIVVSVITLGFNFWTWSKKQKSEQVNISRELMDRVKAKQERFDEYYDVFNIKPETGNIGKEFEVINEVLEEIYYYGLVKDSDLLEQIKNSDLLKHDKVKISELWKDLKFRSRDIQNRVKSNAMEGFFADRIKKHRELLVSCEERWKPDDFKTSD
jgi:hypothetical protein